MKQRICSKAAELSKVEFSYTNSCNFDIVNTLDLDCSGLVMDAVVFALKIKNIPLLLKTGKRLAARIYKIYYHTLLEISKETGGYLNCYSPDRFLIIYPKERNNVSDVVNIALKTAELISMDLRAPWSHQLRHRHRHWQRAWNQDVVQQPIQPIRMVWHRH